MATSRYRIEILGTRKGYTWVMYNPKKAIIARAPKFWEGKLGKNHAKQAAMAFQKNAPEATISILED